jgi:hypothetical protein
MGRVHLLLIGGTIAPCVGLMLAALAMLPEHPGITKANFDRIREGMTQADAERIFGRRSRQLAVLCNGSGVTYVEGWTGENGARAVFVFRNDVIWGDGRWIPSTETISDKLRRLLRPFVPDSR